VKVTNKRNGRSVVVTITDRGPFIRGRVIDLTMAGANAIGMGYGIAPVTLERL
jgi:rare lipoprotein A